MKKIFKIILLVLVVLVLGLYGYQQYKKKENLLYQTAPYFDAEYSSGAWEVMKRPMLFSNLMEKDIKYGVNMRSRSVSDESQISTLGQIHFSLYMPSLMGDISEGINGYKEKDYDLIKTYSHYFLSFYFPYEKKLFDLGPLIYYAIDGEEPILTREGISTIQNSTLYYKFHANVYDFIRKCRNGKYIDFYIVIFGEKTIHLHFSLQGFTKTYLHAKRLLYEQWMQDVKTYR